MDMKAYTRVSIEDLQSAEGKDIVQIYKNYWWIVDNNCNVLFFRGKSPQCNTNKSIAESIRDRIYKDYSVVQIPIALIPINPHDY